MIVAFIYLTLLFGAWFLTMLWLLTLPGVAAGRPARRGFLVYCRVCPWRGYRLPYGALDKPCPKCKGSVGRG